MAQFVEVMKQAKRMCADRSGICSYSNCPLDNGKKCRLNIDLDGEDYNELERIIMDWAKEHPEPVYPNLNEAWINLFPDSLETPCPKRLFGEDYYPIFVCAEHDCAYCKAMPMHPDVAKKLGIKPVEFAGMTDGFCCVGKRRDDSERP